MTYNYKELFDLVKNCYDALPDNIKHIKLISNDVTFEEWCLSKIKPGESIHIDYDNYTYTIIKE